MPNNKYVSPERQEDDLSESAFIEGRRAVTEALRSGRTIDKIYILYGSNDAALSEIRSAASVRGIPVNECDRRRLDSMSRTGAHQGVIASAAAGNYSTLRDILMKAGESGEAPLVVVCDGINDPHNLGAIIRTAGAAGAHGVVIPKHRSVGLTAVVAKAAAGALEYVPVARVPNITAALRELKDGGLWVYGTSDQGADGLYTTDLTGPAAIVIGSEGEGMSRLARENCDFVMSIPMRGEIPSLNASNAAAVVLFETLRQRVMKR